MGLISIIVPVAPRVHRLVLQTRQLENLALRITGHDFEFIFVDDGSHQHSISTLENKAKNDKRYRVIKLTRDFGPTALLLAGITYASGDCAGYFSGRHLDPCQVFCELIRHWEANVKVVIGKWEQPYSKSIRLRGESSVGTIIRRRFFPNRIYFEDVSSLLLDKEVFYNLSQINDPNSDIIEFLAWTGFRTLLVEYSLQPFEGGDKKFVFKDQSLMLGYPQSLYSPRTFRTSLSIGLFLATLGALTTIGLIFTYEYYQRIISGWWMLIGLIVFIFGVQLSLMGVFGEQLFHSLEKVRSRPVFVVDSIINPPISASIEGREKLEKMILSLWSIRKRKGAVSSPYSQHPSEEQREE
jgi:glycosyltransferase involved in cell wall biosynthesis